MHPEGVLHSPFPGSMRHGETMPAPIQPVRSQSRDGSAIPRMRDVEKGRKQRVLPIGRTAVKLLENYLHGIRPHLQTDPEQRAQFLDQYGRRYPYQTLRRRLHAYAGKGGISVQVTPHTFRRSCTTEILRGGANMYHVKEMLGHESLDTLKHYTHLTTSDLRKTHRKCHPRERER